MISYALFFCDTNTPYGLFVSLEEAEFERTMIPHEGRPSEIIKINMLDLLNKKIERFFGNDKSLPCTNC